MERERMADLVRWKTKPNRKPLILKGARQTGKTWLMKAFGEEYFEKTAYISFYQNVRMQRLFEQGYSIAQLIISLGIEAGIEITPGNTLIVFDEIQESPHALESLKRFSEEAPEYHLIAAGSLLGVALHGHVSFPVGKVDMISLYPMTYREFLAAMGENALHDALNAGDFNIINTFHDKYLFWLKNYYYVGGMPEVVQYFSKNRDFNVVREMQNNLLTQYRDDFGKHIQSSMLPRVHMVWESIPIQLAKENKKFFFGQIKKGARSADFEESIQWLLDCGLIYKVHRVNEPHIPLSFYKDFSAYKLFLADVGLLSAMSELDAGSLLEGNHLFVEFKGALTEQFVLQQLISDTEYTPFYFGTKQATFEMDFMIQKGKDIIPIEVKASSNLRSQSLKAFCEKYQPPKAVKFSSLPYVEQANITNMPLYSVCLL